MADKDEKRKVAKKPNAITRFWRETVGELRKVSWPTRKEAGYLTIIVLIVMIISSAVLYAVDILAVRLMTLAVGL